VLGLYALSAMERDGPVYGYSLADRISERTGGGWRPGAGAIYPALQGLVEKGFARASLDGRRRVYRITPAGRAFLRRVRDGFSGRHRGDPDLSALWSEIAGASDPGQHQLDHLRRHLERITELVEGEPDVRAGAARLLDQLRAELRVTESRLAALDKGARRATPRRRV
jgi:DNA-binding PadR family transcriptional regulator